jgi:hypothetical protein
MERAKTPWKNHADKTTLHIKENLGDPHDTESVKNEMLAVDPNLGV